MKYLLRAVAVLLVVNTILIYMHYKQAGEAFAKGDAPLTYAQEIEVVNRPDALYIRHHFRNLSEDRQEIVWPATSVNRSCYLEEATSCERLDDNVTAFLEGVNDSQSVSYEIPKEGSMQKNALFHEPFAALHGMKAAFTTMHITDEPAIGGIWINGLERVGEKKMDSIDYLLYRGAGEVSDLYWQQRELPLVHQGKALSVFGAGVEADRFGEVDEALHLVGADHSTIVIDNENPAIDTARFMITSLAKVDQVADRIFTNHMHSRFSVSGNAAIVEVLASIMSGKPVGADNTRHMVQTFFDTLSEEESKQFRKLLEAREGQAIDAAVLDELVLEVTGFKTRYFSRNMQDDSVRYPFLFEDPREVALEGEVLPDVQIILKDGRAYYPAKQLLSGVGYDVSSNERSIYIENALRQFRFPKKELFYVYNDRKFNVVTMPFEIIDEEFYFEENWFKRLFLLSIDKSGETIEIVPITRLLEEADR
ncbi:hypothetical protein MHZ95_02595 [Sporosarcina sp. ACRSM]|uniref:hypothetical protein n=1 Tax=Sporosarcina sp. ACRSM TaxID=2918216 RepID=UPI001EF5F6AD|nr:hypothetical protein [Sporosarcina sp. ACRSM]MCG7334166.1 hypothetical protein [Sporosarcina sp. ACRSM]